jgi:DNA-binding response OmpR family regulator
MKVLVVDDEGFVAELVRLAIEADGHSCLVAKTHDAAAEILASARIDLLALDLVIDGANSIDWLEDLLLAHPELHGRVCVLTGRLIDPVEAPRIRACGARVIHKPFTLQQLRETVRMLVPPDPPPRRPRRKPPEAES